MYIYIYIYIYELPQTHCADNREETLFHDYMYITPVLLLKDLSTLCVVDHL